LECATTGIHEFTSAILPRFPISHRLRFRRVLYALRRICPVELQLRLSGDAAAFDVSRKVGEEAANGWPCIDDRQTRQTRGRRQWKCRQWARITNRQRKVRCQRVGVHVTVVSRS